MRKWWNSIMETVLSLWTGICIGLIIYKILECQDKEALWIALAWIVVPVAILMVVGYVNPERIKMRDKETLMTGMNDLKLLLQYLYMDENHYVEAQNTLGVPLRIRMTDTCVFKVKNMNFPDVPEHSDELSIGTLLAIISQLRDVPAVEFSKSFDNRWEEIKALTAIQTSLNR